MRKYIKPFQMNLILVFVLIFVQFHCLLNPIVREILDLDPSKKKNNLLQLSILLGLYGGPSATITPSVGFVILADTKIRVVFNRSMNPTSLTAILGIPLNQTWSDTFVANDTVVLSGSLPVGKNSFQLDGSDSNGFRLATVTGTYTILAANTNLYYVSPSGNNGNPGTTPGSAKLTIPSAITGATAPAAILVSEGNYPVDSGLGTQVNLVNNVSLYGGFSSDFLNRNSNLYITKIEDTTVSVVPDSLTISAGATITSSTILDGFTIRGSSNPNATTGTFMAIYCFSGSPTITNNRVEAGSNINGNSVGILLESSSANIANNTIHGGVSTTQSTFGISVGLSSSPTITSNVIYGGNSLDSAHGIYNTPHANTPTIINNTVEGGTGSISYGLNSSHPSNSIVTGNSFDGGTGNTSMAIYHGFGAGDVNAYQQNTLFTTGGTNRYCFYEGGGTNPLSFNGNRLFNCPTALYFDNATTFINDIGTINGGTAGGASFTGNYQ
ncbi:hypothetical protein [Leptospira kanakyensis]|uniref:hypothetical protein n=1 Tax=Leptospira kanakyensis TaxID=2484968 RepID=UPI00223D0B46|nr:hypothetical protein [Leptospira kanakyensis]MCW7468124.1 DUF1565 domain-containing protein [Leptospira kanakyensis]